MRNLSNRIGEKADGQNILPREPSPLQVVSHLIQLFFSSQQKLLGTAPFFLVGSISELPFFVGTAQKLRGEIPWWLFQALWIETSAKSNENVEEAFTQLAKKISQHHSSWAKLGGLGVQNDLTI
jgi:GTPase SAR1 family protein